MRHPADRVEPRTEPIEEESEFHHAEGADPRDAESETADPRVGDARGEVRPPERRDQTAEEEELAETGRQRQDRLFGGLVAALWRANLAAGVSNAGIRGLAFGVAGVGILGVFEFALFLDWLGAAFNPMAVFAQSPVLDTGVIAGTALAFAVLASLVVGFAQSTDLFGRRERMVSQRAPQPDETG